VYALLHRSSWNALEPGAQVEAPVVQVAAVVRTGTVNRLDR
jgi:hypothetical protein